MAAPRRFAIQSPPLGQEDPQPQVYETAWEAFHQRFRQFQYEEAAGPREVFCQLWELCSQWLKPQIRSVEQILALFVLEKFLQILPADTENIRSLLSPEMRQQIFMLIEDLQKDSWGPDTKINMRDMLLEQLVPTGTLLTSTNMHVRPPAIQLMEPARELLESLLAEEIDIEQLKSILNLEFDLLGEYKYLEPPGEEPPEQLLSDSNGPQENQNFSEDQNQSEMPGTSQEIKIEADHDEVPLPNEQLVLLGDQQQPNIPLGFLEILMGNVAQGGPIDEPGPSHGSGPYGHQFISQEEDNQNHIMSSNPFAQTATFSEVVAVFTDEERKKCRVCKKEFMYQLGLMETTQVATKRNRYRCSICGKGFKGKSYVIAHRVKHTNERPFSCRFCQKSYKHKSSLARHLKIHKRENECKESQGSQSPRQDASQ